MADVGDAVSFWHPRDVRLAALSDLFLSVGLAASFGGTGGISDVAFVGALVAGGATFVPSSLRRVLRGQLDVGTLMTRAAIGDVLPGELGEARLVERRVGEEGVSKCRSGWCLSC